MTVSIGTRSTKPGKKRRRKAKRKPKPRAILIRTIGFRRCRVLNAVLRLFRSSLPKTFIYRKNARFSAKGAKPFTHIFSNENLSKKRILEVYLNVIEWGDGIYGAEAASRYYFKKSASNLTASEAAYLSAMIPSPLNVFNPKKNPKRVARRQRVILRGMNYIKLAY